MTDIKKIKVSGVTYNLKDDSAVKNWWYDDTGSLVVPIIQTGTVSTNYFQSQKFRGEGDASTYYHTVYFGYTNQNHVDFYEYGCVYNSWQNTTTATSDASNKITSLQLDKLVERSNTLTYPGKSGTLTTLDDIPEGFYYLEL